jgi:hypothetical protein
MPRFSLKSLFASFILISVGITLLVAISLCGNGYGGYDMRTAFPLWFAGGAAIGAGILIPYKRALWGAKMGFKVQLALLKLYVAVIFIGAVIGSMLGG